MTPDAIASRLQLLRSHKGKLAEQMRRTEAAIHFTDGQIKEVEHWAEQMATPEDFERLARELMEAQGFVFEKADVDQRATVLSFRKPGDEQTAWVTASARELRINNTAEAMRGLVEARVKNALNTYEHHKATPVDPPADVEAAA